MSVAHSLFFRGMRPDMVDLTIGGETFRVDVAGDATKPAVLLSNALGTDLAMWDEQIAELGRHFRVIRYDPRGHGGSVVGSAPGSIARLGADALAILDALEIDTAHFIGLSMGGAVGLWLLVNAPHRVGRAVLASTAARIGSPDMWNARITSVLADGMADVAAGAMKRWFSPAFAAREPGRVATIHAMLRATPPQGYADCCAALRDMDLRASLAQIESEVLVVTGRDDPGIPAEDGRALVEGIAGAEHVVLAAHHLSNIEARDAFNAAVIAFLTRPVAKASSRAGSTQRTASPMKRGGAGRRSNAARRPLKKAPGKRTTAKRAAAKRVVPKKTAGGGTKTKAQAHRRPTKTRSTRRAPAKSASKAASKTVAKRAARKTPVARRPTPTATARGTVTKKAAKRATTAAAKKAPKKAAAKTTKKLPTTRRKPAGKPRRPNGRRKP